MSQSGRARKKRAPRQKRRSGETRAKLLGAARSVFSERGLEAPSIDDITERADTGKGTFYYHFDSKDELIHSVMEDVIGGLVAAMSVKCEGVADLPEILDRIIGAHIEFFSERWQDFVLYFHARADLALEDSYPGLEPAFMGYLACIEDLIANALGRPATDVVLRRIACAVAGLVSGYYSFAAIASEEDDIDAAFRGLRGAMVASLTRFVAEASPPTGVGV